MFKNFIKLILLFQLFGWTLGYQQNIALYYKLLNEHYDTFKTMQDVDSYVQGMNELCSIHRKIMAYKREDLPSEDSLNDWQFSTSLGNPEHLPYLLEGDMVLSAEQIQLLVADFRSQLSKIEYCQANNCNERKKRILTSDLSRRWKEFPIPFIIQSDVNRQAILEGIENWERTTCITFEEKEELPSDSSGLNFVFGEGCFSNVGMVKGRNQRIGIGRNCDNPFVVSHEIAHALGFFHEQSRWDRDDFVEIQFANILPGFLNQFLKFSSSLTTTFGIKYDLGSVMHYDAFGYAKEGMATILTKDVNYQETIGQRFRLSFDDVKKMNFAYCNASCPFQLPCLHSGYTDPKNCSKCRCPDGLTGLLCSKVARTKTLCGDQLIFKSEEKYKKLQFKGVGECNYLIKAPRDSRICLSMDVIHFRDHCQQNSFLEIHYQTSLGRTGAL
uniref:Zinc metalloproteinase n=1 Tax=Meloidogyne enterolobii TaxID=390850 RepID=A0A6V7UV70_MELEN|nr:unnamed protein product [Meloidogyne enterolobii]